MEAIDTIRLITFQAVEKFKSVRRAIRRGKVSPEGIIYPNRPFNNRKPSKGRKLNKDKKVLYGKLKSLKRGIQ